jgi:hypothetical protein
MKKIILLVLFIIIQNVGYSQKFGDSYSSVLNNLNNITKSSYNKFIECDFNVGGIEGVKTYGFDSEAKLVSLITKQYLNSDDGKTLFNSYHSKYYDMFGSPTINKNIEICFDGPNCSKIKSKWEKSTESIILTYYALSGESIVQFHYIKRK